MDTAVDSERWARRPMGTPPAAAEPLPTAREQYPAGCRTSDGVQDPGVGRGASRLGESGTTPHRPTPRPTPLRHRAIRTSPAERTLLRPKLPESRHAPSSRASSGEGLLQEESELGSRWRATTT